MAWSFLGDVDIVPSTEEAVIGPVSVPAYGGLSFRCRLLPPASIRPGYGLVFYRSTFGRELGSVPCYPRPEVETYRLGEGMRAEDRTGLLVFQPCRFSLQWARLGVPLTVRFLVDTGPDLPADRYMAEGWADGEGRSLTLTAAAGLGRLTFPE